MNNKKIITYFFLSLLSFYSFVSLADYKEGAWESLPIQHKGRVKPFDTFSRELLFDIYGHETFKGRSAVDVILSWLIIPDHWETTPFILIEKNSIKKSLGLDRVKKRFSPQEIKTNHKFALQLIELQALRQKDQELNDYFKNLQKIETKLTLYEAVVSSWILKIIPPKEGTAWLSPVEAVEGQATKAFQESVKAYVQWISTNHQGKGVQDQQNKKKIIQSLDHFQQTVFKGNPEKWFQRSKLRVEIVYNHLKPFRLAALFYFSFLVLSLFLFFLNKFHLLRWFLPLAGVGFLIHGLGMLFRSYIMSRPPVSNMYETVLWVPWVALIAGIFYFKKSRLIFIASVILAFACLFLTHTAPQVLDARLQPLEAVLRSSFWLSTHVLIITMSYAFFFLSFVLGDMGLLYYIFSKKDKLDLVKSFSNPIYRLIQWGVILLTVGTILGAIWADYSWGRFWGWDPKESWALISLLAYLALLHGRLIGWMKPLLLSVSSVLMFFLVIMAWYGVNFILGKGLHSYGFGSGGFEYMGGFFALHLILCGAIAFQHFYLPQPKA